MNYQNFSMEITGAAGDYRLSVYSSVTNDMVQERFTLPFPAGSLERIVREVDYLVEGPAIRRDAGGSRTAIKCQTEPLTISSLQDFGTRLFAALFPPQVLDCFHRSVAATDDETGVRLQLSIEPPELAHLPWELLYDPGDGDYLCLKPDLAIVRFKTIVDRIGDQALGYVRRPLRILGIVSNPADLPQLDVEGEKQRISEAVESIDGLGPIEIEWVDDGKLKTLREATAPDQKKAGWHILHFVGHGTVEDGEATLAFESADELGHDRVTEVELRRVLRRQGDLRLVVLNACQGATGTAENAFSSLATQLVANRTTPAVVAMQWRIPDESAITFAQTLYEGIAGGRRIEAAMAEARVALLEHRDEPSQWANPTLTTRSDDGTLFPAPGDPISLVEHMDRFDRRVIESANQRPLRTLTGLVLAVAAIVVCSIALGIDQNFRGPPATVAQGVESVDYRGFLQTWNWPINLALTPLAIWMALYFLRSFDLAIGQIHRWMAPTNQASAGFSDEYQQHFQLFWRRWRVTAPAIVASVVVTTEWRDWFAPLVPRREWVDLDWSVAIRQADAPPAPLLFLFNTSVFLSEIILVSCTVLTLGVMAHFILTIAGAMREDHWIARGYERFDSPRWLPLQTTISVFLLFMALMLVATVASTAENRNRSASGIDIGIQVLAGAAIAAPVLALAAVMIFKVVSSRLSVDPKGRGLNRINTAIALLLVVLVCLNFWVLFG